MNSKTYGVPDSVLSWQTRGRNSMKRATNRRTMVENSKTPEKSRSSPVHRFFIYKVGMLRRALDRYSTPAITDQFDMTLAEWRVLTLLYGSSPATVRELCDLLQADK